jgi:calcium-dependent protein kinase
MCQQLGTLPYLAPEVLNHNYTSQCDLWSLGVIVYTLLAGHMPFPGSSPSMMQRINEGKFHMKHERWRTVSKEAKSFVKSLLHVDPDRRLSAPTALQHAWLAHRRLETKKVEVDSGVINALRDFSYASEFRRCCMMLMAWCLSNEERATVRQYFLALDRNKHGTIILPELKRAMQEAKHGTPEKEVRQMFDTLDFNSDEEIQYSDFLAAMLNTRIQLSDSLLLSAFKRFDADHSGYITVDNVQTVMGHTFDAKKARALIREADHTMDGQISYQEFVMYVTGERGKYDLRKDATHNGHGKPACCTIC